MSLLATGGNHDTAVAGVALSLGKYSAWEGVETKLALSGSSEREAELPKGELSDEGRLDVPSATGVGPGTLIPAYFFKYTLCVSSQGLKFYSAGGDGVEPSRLSGCSKKRVTLHYQAN